jgi:hypothetical protein
MKIDLDFSEDKVFMKLKDMAQFIAGLIISIPLVLSKNGWYKIAGYFLLFSMSILLILWIIFAIRHNIKFNKDDKNLTQLKTGIYTLNKFHEELLAGIRVMEDIVQKNSFGNLLPKSVWEKTPEIPQELIKHILKNKVKFKSTYYKPEDLEIHLKNYFIYIVGNLNQEINLAILGTVTLDEFKLKFFSGDKPESNYLISAKEIDKLILNIKSIE